MKRCHTIQRFTLMLDVLAEEAAPSRAIVVYADGSILLMPFPHSDSPLEVVLPEISE